MVDHPKAPIEHTLWIDADPSVVFDYFTDAEKLVQWMGDSAVLSPSPGGEYRVTFKEGWVSRGKFLTVDRPHRLVYTVGWEGHQQFPAGSTRVELEFTPHNGGTTVRLRHFGPPSKGLEADGWLMYLRRLAAVAEEKAPPPNPFDQLVR